MKYLKALIIDTRSVALDQAEKEGVMERVRQGKEGTM